MPSLSGNVNGYHITKVYYNIFGTGEASQLLRKLITCRKLGMTITPATPKVLNYTLFQGQSSSDGNECRSTVMDKERSSGRRKQCYPTKANNVEEVIDFFFKRMVTV